MLGVGGAIVLSGLVVPQRVGLSLELGVALMLILLGVVNVIGIVREARETLASRGRNHPDASSSRQLEMRLDESGFYQAVRP